MHKGKINWQFKNFRIYKELYGKLLKRDWVGRAVFLIQILQIFGGHCNRSFWRASKIFPKWTVFVLTESWSGDQLMQKAYCNKSAETTVIKYIVVQRCFIQGWYPVIESDQKNYHWQCAPTYFVFHNSYWRHIAIFTTGVLCENEK